MQIFYKKLEGGKRIVENLRCVFVMSSLCVRLCIKLVYSRIIITFALEINEDENENTTSFYFYHIKLLPFISRI